MEASTEPLHKAWIALGMVAYAVTVATLYVAYLGNIRPGLTLFILNVIVASTCAAYLGSLRCRCCGAGLTADAMGLRRQCHECGQRP